MFYLPNFAFFKKCFFFVLFGKIVRDRLQIFGARETGTRKRKKEGKRPSSLTRPIPSSSSSSFPIRQTSGPAKHFVHMLPGPTSSFFFLFGWWQKFTTNIRALPSPLKSEGGFRERGKRKGKGSMLPFPSTQIKSNSSLSSSLKRSFF